MHCMEQDRLYMELQRMIYERVSYEYHVEEWA